VRSNFYRDSATMWLCQEGAEHPNICSENNNSVY